MWPQNHESSRQIVVTGVVVTVVTTATGVLTGDVADTVVCCTSTDGVGKDVEVLPSSLVAMPDVNGMADVPVAVVVVSADAMSAGMHWKFPSRWSIAA